MSWDTEFFVAGTPRPQGSMQAIVSKSTGRAFMKTSSTTATWRNVVVDALTKAIAEDEMPVFPDGPVEVELYFDYNRPKSHPKKRVAVDKGVKYNGADIDKLARAILDGLTVSGVLGDDTQVARLVAIKQYTHGQEGVWIRVTRVAGGYPPAGGWSEKPEITP